MKNILLIFLFFTVGFLQAQTVVNTVGVTLTSGDPNATADATLTNRARQGNVAFDTLTNVTYEYQGAGVWRKIKNTITVIATEADTAALTKTFGDMAYVNAGQQYVYTTKWLPTRVSKSSTVTTVDDETHIYLDGGETVTLPDALPQTLYFHKEPVSGNGDATVNGKIEGSSSGLVFPQDFEGGVVMSWDAALSKYKISGSYGRYVVTSLPFAVTGGTTMNFEVTRSGGESFTIDWGDGTVETGSSGVAASHTYGTAYTGNVTISTTSGAFEDIDRLDFTQGQWSFDLANLPSELLELVATSTNNLITGNIADAPTGLTNLQILGSNTVSGDIANAPRGIGIFRLTGSNTLSGDVAKSPPNVTNFTVLGFNTLTGDINNIAKSVTILQITGSNTIFGDIVNAPPNLTFFYLDGFNTLSGNVADTPPLVTFLYITGSNTLTGDINDIPKSVTNLQITGSNTLSGDIINAPPNLTVFRLLGSNTLSGDIINAPLNLNYFYVEGANTLSYSTTRTWASSMRYFSYRSTASPWTTAEVDLALNDLAAVTTWTSEKTVDVGGTNAAVSAASAAARTTLAGVLTSLIFNL